jgi:hypothetical protein
MVSVSKMSERRHWRRVTRNDRSKSIGLLLKPYAAMTAATGINITMLFRGCARKDDSRALASPRAMGLGNRPAFRELAEARIIILRHTFAKGEESGYRFTYWGCERRFEILSWGAAEKS